VNGGLRDKPSKSRDFYHSCYCLSGLSVVQHQGGDPHYSKTTAAQVAVTHPCYNIRTEHVARILEYFETQENDDDEDE